MVHNIVIVGGNFAGASEAHHLLTKVLPVLNNTPGSPKFKVTLVSPSAYTFFKVAAPRALVQPDLTQDEKIFASIPKGFAKYSSADFTFVQGTATSLDEATKTIAVSPPGSTTAAPPTVTYDSLVIATGTTSNSPLWTLHGPHTISSAALTDYHKRITTAKTILIAGGGAVGVETAGEIMHQFHPKELTLLSGSSRLLARVKTVSLAKDAEAKLVARKVRVVHHLRVASVNEGAGKTTLTLSDGSTKTVDVYIDATGGKPNTAWLPASWLDADQRVAADVASLRATQAPKGVYAVGDAASYSNMGVFDAVYTVGPLAGTIWEDLAATAPGLTGTTKQKPFKQMEAETMVVTIGPSGGVGVLLGWRIWNWMVWLIKSRTFLIGKAGLAGGSYA